MKYLIGNWKANKNLSEVEIFFKTFADLYNQKKLDWSDNLEVVLCPPFIYLEQAKRLVKKYNLPFKLGAQDISPYDNGAFTGEVTARQIKEFAEFVLIGHSERRKNFKELDTMLAEKVKQANGFRLQIVYCVPDEKAVIPEGVSIVAYEPVWAIGSGQTDTPENAGRIASTIKKDNNIKSVIYGGSIKPENIAGFWESVFIDGVLPGGSSLYADSFWQMILHATAI